LVVEAGDLEVAAEVGLKAKADAAGVVDAGSWVVPGALHEAVAGEADEAVAKEEAKEEAEEVEEDAVVTVPVEECKLDEGEGDRPFCHSKLTMRVSRKRLCVGEGG